MAILNRKYGYLFLAEPYCASRAVAKALLTQDGSVDLVDTWVHNPFEKLVELGIVKYHEPLYKFSVIRNPADLLVTKYHHLTGWHKQGFKPFLRSHLEAPGPSLFMHAAVMDKTLRYERLESELNDTLEARGAPPVKLELIGKTETKKHWRSYYSDDEIKTMLERLPDFKTFGYVI
jgi:hypothetical protein